MRAQGTLRPAQRCVGQHSVTAGLQLLLLRMGAGPLLLPTSRIRICLFLAMFELTVTHKAELLAEYEATHFHQM